MSTLASQTLTDAQALAKAVTPIPMPADLPAADLTQNARTILAKRYLVKNGAGEALETPEQMFWRVAANLAATERAYGRSAGEIEQTAREFYALMTERRLEPNSPTLMNAGRPLGQLSACFVVPVADALSNGHDGIYDTLRHIALIHQSGGGTGMSFSRLRPKGSMVRSTTGVASGPVSFMKLYNASTDAVKQGGTRRGANMGVLRVDHPDILEFIDCKQDLTQVTNFNISVGVTDAFMRAVRQGTRYDLIDPASKAVVGSLDAGAVFDKIVTNAWTTGEPGILFLDQANRYNPVPHLGEYEASNPCGEQFLLPYDVCNLGSMNVGWYVRDGAMQWDAFKRDVRTATRLLDNVIDANNYPLPEITALSQRIRRIGLGVMGFADALVRLGLPYDSAEGVAFGREVMRVLDEEAKAASEALADERGVFPEWARSIWGPDETCARDAEGNRVRPMQRLRNCNVTTVAPTGTISIFAGCSSGLEPLFAVAFMRNQAGVMMPDVNADFVAAARAEGWYSDALMERIAKTGSVQQPEVPARWQRVFVTANAIAPEWHVGMQAAFQAHCDSAISKTCNFANDATQADVRAIYVSAWEQGCKGVTIYRDGSRDGQVLSTGATAKATAERKGDGAGEAEAALRAELAAATAAARQAEADRAEAEQRLVALAEVAAQAESTRAALGEARAQLAAIAEETAARRIMRARPDRLRSTSLRKETPLGTMFVHVTEDDRGQPFEVFINLGKAGGSAMADAEAMGRLISLCMRSGIPLRAIHKQLRGISSDRAVGLGPNKVLSVPDAIGIALEEWAREQEGVQTSFLTPAQGTAAVAPPAPVPSLPLAAPATAETLALAGHATGGYGVPVVHEALAATREAEAAYDGRCECGGRMIPHGGCRPCENSFTFGGTCANVGACG